MILFSPGLSLEVWRIIGEAATKIDAEFKADYPYIEWRKMAGTRNRLIHDYFGVDYDIVWNIIETKIPDLKDNVESILKDHSG